MLIENLKVEVLPLFGLSDCSDSQLSRVQDRDRQIPWALRVELSSVHLEDGKSYVFLNDHVARHEASGGLGAIDSQNAFETA
jgi:hypothetical protein